jgi:predicted DCC family thiol-disulfide oxidoreductase YuxK
MNNWQKIAVIGYIIPKFIRDFFYNIISRNRKNIMTDNCVIDKLKVRDKYII